MLVIFQLAAYDLTAYHVFQFHSTMCEKDHFIRLFVCFIHYQMLESIFFSFSLADEPLCLHNITQYIDVQLIFKLSLEKKLRKLVISFDCQKFIDFSLNFHCIMSAVHCRIALSIINPENWDYVNLIIFEFELVLNKIISLFM